MSDVCETTAEITDSPKDAGRSVAPACSEKIRPGEPAANVVARIEGFVGNRQMLQTIRSGAPIKTVLFRPVNDFCTE